MILDRLSVVHVCALSDNLERAFLQGPYWNLLHHGIYSIFKKVYC